MPWRELPARLNASTDYFIRTSDEGHKRFVRDFLQRMYDNGDIYQDVYAGLLLRRVRGLQDRGGADGRRPLPGPPDQARVDRGDELLLPALRLPGQAARALRRAAGLRAAAASGSTRRARSSPAASRTSASRARASRGASRCPWDESQVTYVWADALINYLSALTYARAGEDLREEFWPVVHHLLAKDILRFHCVFWPAMLLSAGYEPPKQLFVHGYLLLDDRKISKSLGNIVEPLELIDVFGADAVRYWCARAVSFGQDGSASIDGIRERYDSELANDLGNLALAHDRDGRPVPRRAAGARRRADAPVDFDALRDDVARGSTSSTSRARSTRSGTPSAALNQYVTAEAPWQLAKDDANAARARRASSTRSSTGSRGRGRARRRTCRETAPKILAALGQAEDRRLGARPQRRRGRGRRDRAASEPLFPRIELPSRRCVIDTHAHLDALDDDPAAVVARARAAGVTRILTVGTRRRAAARARARRRARRASSPIVGIHPHEASDATGRRRARCASCSRTRRRSRWGRRASTGSATTRRATRSGASSTRSSRSRPSSGKPVVIHTRAADEDTLAALAGFDGTVVLHCFSSPHLLPTALERGWYVSFAGNATYPKAVDLRLAAREVPADRILAETDCAVPRAAAACAAGRTSRRTSCTRSPRSRRRAARTPPSSSAQIDANAAACFGLP